MNLNQASFSNRTAGGVNSVAFSALGKFSGNHKKDKFTFVTDQTLANQGSFGVTPAEKDSTGIVKKMVRIY